MYNPTFFNLALDRRRELVGAVEHDRRMREARCYARQHLASPALLPRGLGVRHAWQRLFATRRGQPVAS